MYITQMAHFLDEEGNIPKQIPKASRELGSFLALVVDATTKEKSTIDIQTGIRCFRKKCEGLIISELQNPKDEIYWRCTKCKNEGTIGSWQGTRWDNWNN
jgi:hypothetical protein